MAKPRKQGQIRLNLDLSAEANDQLEDLIQRSGANSRGEVIRHALRVYDALLEIEQSGGKVVATLSNGERMLLKLV